MKALIINCSPVRDGATAFIAATIAGELEKKHETKSVCIDDFSFSFCKGCRSCHLTAKCVMEDGAQRLVALMNEADIIVSVAPSYWMDVPGQFKAFIDRCTPWCNTHEPHASIASGKKGYSVALRTGPGIHECERIIGTIEHFYGHMEIECAGHLGLTSVENREKAEKRRDEIIRFCSQI